MSSHTDLGAGGRDVLLPAASPECKESRRLGTDRSPGNLRRAKGGEENENNCYRGQSCAAGLREWHLPAQGCPWGCQQDVAAAGRQQHPWNTSLERGAPRDRRTDGHGQRGWSSRRDPLRTARRERSALPELLRRDTRAGQCHTSTRSHPGWKRVRAGN